MSEEKKPEAAKITTLPSMEHTFTLNVIGNETKQAFDGTFTYKRLNLGKRMEANKMEARLREERVTLSTDVNRYIEIISYLRFGLVAFPDWWVKSNFGLELYDANIVVALNNECEKFENEWNKKIQGE